MDIREALGLAASALSTRVEEDEETTTALKELVDTYLQDDGEGNGPAEHLDYEDVVTLCELSYVAGQLFQSQYAGQINVPMDADTIGEFLGYLTGRIKGEEG